MNQRGGGHHAAFCRCTDLLCAGFEIGAELPEGMVGKAQAVNHRVISHLRYFTFDGPLGISLGPIEGEPGELGQ